MKVSAKPVRTDVCYIIGYERNKQSTIRIDYFIAVCVYFYKAVTFAIASFSDAFWDSLTLLAIYAVHESAAKLNAADHLSTNA